MRIRFLLMVAVFIVVTVSILISQEAVGDTIWPATAVPVTIDSGSDRSAELGVKFRADFSGLVSGIRFYKASTNSGTHTGSLWRSNGTRLARATFSNETASGWQQVNFSTPVAISANTVYVASYHANNGHYSWDQNFFASAGVDRPPLHALANGVSGVNGVYVYSSSTKFPNLGRNSSNYWVDVVFSPTLVDTTAPTVTAFSVPASSDALTVSITSFSATDNVAVSGYLVNESSSKPAASATGWTANAPNSYTCATAGSKTLYAWAKDAAGNVSVSSSATVTITIPPDTTPPIVTAFSVPASASTLTVAITNFSATDNVAVSGYLVNESSSPPGASATGWTTNVPNSYTFATPGSKTLYAWAKDAAGNVSAATGSTSATVTVTLVASAGVPILMITAAANPFSDYYAEILRTEGLNEFAEKDISAVTASMLAAYDLVILGEMPLSASQVTMLSDWVNGGGRLVAMRPDDKLAALLGLTDLGASLSDAYLLVDTSSGPGAGIVNQTIQFHGTADLYALNGATSLATLYSSATTGTSRPAVTLWSVGANGGQAAAFTYDLARSVVYTRQGNPVWSGQERDSFAPIRSDDLYYGAASFDRQPDWVDLGKVAIPQADEQQRLLANLLIQMNLDKKPLPRFWYFPRNLPAVVVMTGDDHGTGGTAGRFNAYQAASPPNCSVDNWECIRGTSYIYTATPLSNAQALTYNNAGFEVALHVLTNCADWDAASLESFYATQLSDWRAKYSSLPAPSTNRTHCIAWSEYTTQAAVELDHGIRLDANYYYWPPSWINDSPGFFTGSGLPMRFVDSSGHLIDVYQATTQMTDESGQTYPFTIDMLLDRAVGSQGYYGAFVVNAHTDQATSSVSDAVIGSAIDHGIPVISARQLLKWLDGRNGSTFTALMRNGNTLSFSISAAQGANGLVAMVPLSSGQTVTAVLNNGNSVPFSMVTVKGLAYARFSALTGSYQVNYGSDTTQPVVTGVSPANGAAGVSTATTVTAIFDKAMDPATITNGTFELHDPTSTIVPAAVTYNATTQTATLDPIALLANATNYFALVRGGATGVKDVAGNPLSADFNWSFSSAAASSGPLSIWPASTVPGVIDTGPDNSVELGVKFRADVSGTISGIRFYKASTNTGTHTANLWTATGTRLATATFNNETASGWQQVTFPTPVPVSANTVYVASYHTSTGHYSDNLNYFASRGVDNPPLHALAEGVAGNNGVFAYGSTSSFPNGGWYSSNYWVDVLFSASAPQVQMQTLQAPQPASGSQAPTLLSIGVTPGNQRIAIGTTQQFTATGSYSDGSTQNLTSTVTWSSSNVNVITVNDTGLVTAYSPGTASISVKLNGIVGSTDVTATEGMAMVSGSDLLPATTPGGGMPIRY